MVNTKLVLQTDQTFVENFWKTNFNQQFIKLFPGGKKAAQKWAEDDNLLSLDELKNVLDIAIKIPKGFIVIDVDDSREAEKLSNYLYARNVKVLMCKTTRGYHFWFQDHEWFKKQKNNGETLMSNYNHVKNFLDITCDVRWGEISGYVKIKQDGVWRDIVLQNISTIKDIGVIPSEVIPWKDLNLPSLIDLKEGEGRRNAFFERVVPAGKRGIVSNESECKELFNYINRHILDDPLPPSEFDNIFHHKAEIWDKIERGLVPRPGEGFEKTSFQHDQFALHIHSEYHGVRKDNLYWVFYQGRYQTGKTLLDQIMIQEMGSIKQHQRTEVRTWLNAIPPKYENPIIEGSQYVRVKNGILNIETHELLDVEPKYFILTFVDCEYEPEIDTSEVDKFLIEIADNDNDVRDLLEEIMGYILLQDQRFQKAFIAVGNGSNGKSTWLKMIQEMLGHENVSAIDYTQVTDKFKTATLLGKLLNIGEEMPNKLTQSPEIFKKLITGDPVQVELKNENTFVLRNKAKFIFTANELPPTTDRSNGFYRRWTIIPFTKEFDETSRDLTLESRIKTESYKSAVLKVSLRGLNRLLTNQRFTDPQKVKDVLEMFKLDNNSVWRFLYDEYQNDSTKLINQDIKQVFIVYKDYCVDQSYPPLGFVKFKKELFNRFKDLVLIDASYMGGHSIQKFARKA